MDLKLNDKQVKLLDIMCHGAQGDLLNNPECYLEGYRKELNELTVMVLRAKENIIHERNGLHKHFVSNNETGFRLNALYEKEVADKAKHYIPPISEVPFCPNCESDNTHENLLKHHYRCYDCGFAWAK